MLLEILLALLIGTFAGIFTGLAPGIHINLVGAIIVSLSISLLSNVPPIFLVVFIVSMSITHVFIDFIPSVFLGAPEDGTELSVLPGHEMLKQGLGFQAVKLTSLGCLYGIFIFIVLAIPLSFVTSKIHEFSLTANLIPILLIGVSLNLILVEKNKLFGLAVFVISGILGLAVLNIGMKEPLLPLLTGLFGTSSLFLAIKSKTKIKKQELEKVVKIKRTKSLITSAIFSPLSIFLPAISSGQIAIIGNQFAKLGKKEFLFMLGVINILTMAFSFLALFLISKTRTGSAAAVESLIGIPENEIFVLIVIVALLSGCLAFFISGILAKKFILILEKMDYTKVCIITIAAISIITILVSGFFGLIVLAVSTLTGVYCISLNVSRVNMMGCLLLQTILFYLV
jgi:putative membrane protein